MKKRLDLIIAVTLLLSLWALGGAMSCSSSSSDDGVSITGMTLSETLRLDTTSVKSRKLTPAFTPEGATVNSVKWSSDTPTVATVDATGTVTAVSPGKAVITAIVGGISAKCTVYVFSLWFYDDFENGSTANWDLRPPSGPDGAFSVVSDGSNALKYEAKTTGGVLATINDQVWASVPSGDFYVEARIKPMTNSSTGNKQLYLLARYQDDKNWYGAGLNVQSSTSSTQVEVAKMEAGSLSRPVQVKKPITMDTTWYTVRFELKGTTLAVYLDGIFIKSVTDEKWSTGKIGLYTANKSFEIDDIKVGDPRDLPVQLAISPTSWATEAKDDAKDITVTAQKPNYEDGTYVDDTFTAVSSNPAVVSVAIKDKTVTLTPLTAGSATITFTSGSESALTRVLEVTVDPEFVQPSSTYSLTGKTTPAAAEVNAYIDTTLSITFDAPPTLGTSGSVRIFKKADDSRVDVIRLKNETDVIGYAGQDGQASIRYVNSDSRIKLVGNTVTIFPHNNKLDYGTEYYVAIADGTIAGTLNGAPFTGIGKAGAWTFTTKPAIDATKTSLTVDDDGTTADFRTVQGALNHLMKSAASDTALTVNVKNGIYEELLFLRGKNNVSIVGESRDGVVIQYKNYETLNSGSGNGQVVNSGSPAGGRAVFLVESADLLTLDTLTLKNTMVRTSAASCQAETIYFNSDNGRLIAKNAAFISEQDTLQLKGYAWFYKSLVAGNVDFIWGANHVALFEQCEIRSLGDSSDATKGGYIVQARTSGQTDKGFVFLNSSLTHGPGPSGSDVPTGDAAATYLARSSGSSSAWDNVAFVNCSMDNHIIPVGWAYDTAGQPKSNPATATAAGGWREWGSAGPGGDMTKRVGGYTLNTAEVESGFTTRAQILGAFSNWNPTP